MRFEDNDARVFGRRIVAYVGKAPVFTQQRDSLTFRLGRDVGIIGVDNWEPMTSGASPTLTSVDLNLKELGREAAELLFASMAGPVEPGIRRVRGRVVAREST